MNVLCHASIYLCLVIPQLHPDRSKYGEQREEEWRLILLIRTGSQGTSTFHDLLISRGGSFHRWAYHKSAYAMSPIGYSAATLMQRIQETSAITFPQLH